MNIGIIGVGVVGGALKTWLEKHTRNNISCYDPGKQLYDDLSACDAVFICVPVPTIGYRQNYSFLEDALNRCPKGADVFIRSTVLPGTADRYGAHSCPEFLTQRFAEKDMEKLPILTGCQDEELLSIIFPGKTVYMVTNKEAELAKYAHNNFASVKVDFFNLIYEICQKEGLEYERVRQCVLLSGHINEAHTLVPGPDGKLGFGGACFPKDLKAFYGTYSYDLLGAVIRDNERIREIKVNQPRIEQLDA